LLLLLLLVGALICCTRSMKYKYRVQSPTLSTELNQTLPLVYSSYNIQFICILLFFIARILIFMLHVADFWSFGKWKLFLISFPVYAFSFYFTFVRFPFIYGRGTSFTLFILIYISFFKDIRPFFLYCLLLNGFVAVLYTLWSFKVGKSRRYMIKMFRNMTRKLIKVFF